MSFDYYGCKLPQLPKENLVVGMALQMKVMDENGEISFHEFATGVSKMEQLGMLESAGDTVRYALMSNNRPVSE